MKTTASSRLNRTLTKAILSAGAIIKRGAAQDRQVKFKSPTSPVTHIDLLAEKKIISLIKAEFPDHIFLAEESDYLAHWRVNATTQGPAQKHHDRYRWIIDPLDGTVNFVHGVPQCSVSIAVEKNGTILAGGIYDVFRNELFLAEKGKGATLNGKRIHVSPQRTIEKSLLITGFPYDHREKAAYYLKFALPFLKQCMDLRRFGSAALDLAWIACGRAEGYWEFNLNPWDVAAGWLIVEEAGGKLTDFKNRSLQIDHPKQILASNGVIHRQMIKVFQQTLGS